MFFLTLFKNIASRLYESPLFHFWRVLGPLKSNVKITKISKNHKWDYDLCFCVSCTREANLKKKSRGAYTIIIFLFKADVPKAPTYLPPQVRFTRKKHGLKQNKKHKNQWDYDFCFFASRAHEKQ